MPYPARLLHDGEEVVADVRPHWGVLAAPVATTVAVLAGSAAAAVAGVPVLARWAVAGLLIVVLGWLLTRYLRWTTTRVVVTSDRLIRRQGVLARQGREIPLGAVTDVSFRQSIVGRIVGAGDLLVESAGRDGREVLASLPHPARLQRELWRVREDRRRSLAGPARLLSIPEQIDKLDDLRRRGVLTEAEFSAQKARLLERS